MILHLKMYPPYLCESLEVSTVPVLKRHTQVHTRRPRLRTTYACTCVRTTPARVSLACAHPLRAHLLPTCVSHAHASLDCTYSLRARPLLRVHLMHPHILCSSLH